MFKTDPDVKIRMELSTNASFKGEELWHTTTVERSQYGQTRDEVECMFDEMMQGLLRAHGFAGEW